MTENLEQLREIAQNATPGPWRFDTDSEEDYEAGIPHSEWPQTLHGPKNSCPSEWAVRVGATHQVDEIKELTWEDVTHIATFDPPTVLALIDRVEAAEAAVQRVRELAVEMANHPMPDAPKGSAWILAEGAQLFAKDVLEALDGGEQE